MVRCTFLVVFLLTIHTAYSQSYILKQSVGADPTNYSSSFSIAIKPYEDQKLSPVFQLPFRWSFFGEHVGTLRVSDNGYLQFDMPDSVSLVPSATVPDPSLPKNAICALWTDLKLESATGSSVDVVVSGTAPFRKISVTWDKLTRNSSYDDITFLVEILEGGDFNIIYHTNANVSGNVKELPGFVGAINKTGREHAFFNNNGQFSLSANSNRWDDDVVLYFRSPNHLHDIAPFSPASDLIINRDLPPSVWVVNYGTDTIHSFMAHYSIEGITHTQSVDGLQLKPLDSIYLTFKEPWLTSVTGKHYTMKVWTEKPNTVTDGHAFNDTLIREVFVNNGVKGDKQVLLEEFTGADCGWCPFGQFVLEDLLLQNPKVIGIAHHSGDGMSSELTNAITYAYTGYFPSGVIDRNQFPDDAYPALSPEYWEDKVKQELLTQTPLHLKLDLASDTQTRTLTIKVSTVFDDYCYGNLRLNVFIVEDSVRGPNISPVWNQLNYFSKDYEGEEGNPLYDLPVHIPGYYYHHVVKGSLTDIWGVSLKGEMLYKPEESFASAFEYPFPPVTTVSYDTTPSMSDFHSTFPGFGANKMKDTRVVAFITALDTMTGRELVINAVEEPVIMTIQSNAVNLPLNEEGLTVSPNPSHGRFHLMDKGKGEDAGRVRIVNILGRTVWSGSTTPMGKIAIDISAEPGGLYYLIKGDGRNTIMKKLIIEK